MASAVKITRKDLTTRELRRALSKARGARAVRRMLAIALVMEGVDRTTVAESYGRRCQCKILEAGQGAVSSVVSQRSPFR